jgi:hypothetical protein
MCTQHTHVALCIYLSLYDHSMPICTQIQGRKRELASLGLKQDGTPMEPKASSSSINSSSNSSDKATDKKLSRGQRQREKARIKRETAAANGTTTAAPTTTADASRYLVIDNWIHCVFTHIYITASVDTTVSASAAAAAVLLLV